LSTARLPGGINLLVCIAWSNPDTTGNRVVARNGSEVLMDSDIGFGVGCIAKLTSNTQSSVTATFARPVNTLSITVIGSRL